MPIMLPGATGEHINIREGVSPFDITFYLWERGDHIEGEIEYNIDILERQTIIRLRDNFIQLIKSVTNDPDQKIEDIDIISENDKQQLTEFNRTQSMIPDCLIHEFFEDQAKIHPSKTAVISGNSGLTFRELNEKANQLANYLVERGAVQGDIIGISIERSVEMIVAVFGILKAGCCYLPLDPSFPDERISFMVNDAKAKLIITQSSNREKLSKFYDYSIVFINEGVGEN